MIEGINLKPQFLGHNPKIKKYEAAIARPGNFAAFEYFAVWIDDDVGYGGMANMTIPYALPKSVKYLDCQDITVCFNGQWIRFDNGFKYITDPLPTIVVCKTDGSLFIHPLGSNSSQMITGKYKYVAIVRGWKSLVDEQDQRLTLFAATENTIDRYVYTDSNAVEETESRDVPLFTWSLEETIEVEGIQGIRAGLLADYRMCLYIHTETETICYHSGRQYIGGSIPPEETTIGLIGAKEGKITLYNLQSTSYDKEQGTAELKLLGDKSGLNKTLLVRQPTNICAYNTSETEIVVEIGTAVVLNTNVLSTFQLKTVLGVPLMIEDVRYEDWKLIFKCFKFNNYRGDFVITHTGAIMTLQNGAKVDAFETTFKPVGLVPDPIDPPELQQIINVEVELDGV